MGGGASASPSQGAVDVVAALEDAGYEPERVAPRYWRAFCPSHAARWPELGVSDDGTLIDCDAGCRSSDVLRELGMNAR